jgi:hypothetical protein
MMREIRARDDDNHCGENACLGRPVRACRELRVPARPQRSFVECDGACHVARRELGARVAPQEPN